MATLSVIITSFNEEQKIKDCLESVAFADEIILVDGSSTDRTVDIARKYTKNIFIRDNNPMLNVNKNFGFRKAKSDWILSLDSDERVTPELQVEVQHILQSSGDRSNGYWIPRKNIIFGKWIEHTGWYPDYQLRLFRRGKGAFPEKHVHEMVQIDGEVGYLKAPLYHLNYETVAQFIRKTTTLYATNEAKVKIRDGYQFRWSDAINFPLQEFLRRYFAGKGYKDGLHGLVLSLLMAFYHLLVFVYIWEEKGFTQQSLSLEQADKVLQTSGKEIQYWLLMEKIGRIKNPLKRLLLRGKSKLHV